MSKFDLLNSWVERWGPILDMDEWDFMDLEPAKEQFLVADFLIDVFDRAEGHVHVLKPTSITSEGAFRYEL